MKFYTLTLKVKKKVDGRYSRSTSNFRSLFNSFVKGCQQDYKNEFKSIQYNKFATEDDAYYIFISNSEAFLEGIREKMNDLLVRAEEKQKQEIFYEFLTSSFN